ncbi:DUF4355 domain-containing protein [Schinkia azotoformans]|uniref:DUF4355 domain-containing protein n=1 Tax=Schinkia azotoformans TaxID=1454 RepID=UPI002DB59C15|nr:DUF4355 domain-containing protein [Schinkia azotoformans]MEC1772829.1 DUF4355 domain-containing protein [Schinkia azotoformans]MED4367452.1 DUF4355 domain-containing protein [Schinkia azotoformans]
MNLEEIKVFFESNKDNEDVKNYLQGLSKVTADGVTTFLESDEGKKLLQPKLDSYFTKGLSTWKENNLQKLIDEEVSKKLPSETPEQKQLKELQQKLVQMEQEKTRESLKNKALSIASEKKLPTSLIDFLIGQDEETTTSNLSKLEEVWNTQLQVMVDEKLKSSGTTPKDGDKPKSFTLDQVKAMSESEISANWEAVQQALQNN